MASIFAASSFETSTSTGGGGGGGVGCSARILSGVVMGSTEDDALTRIL